MNDIPKRLLLGLILISVLLGLLVGLSTSPLAGTIVSAFVAVASLAFSARSSSLSAHARMHMAGTALIVFSVSFFVGAAGGVAAKLMHYRETPAQAMFPWTDDSKPDTAYEAVDWILTSGQLLRRGYTASQIRAIYALRKVKAPSSSPFGPFSTPAYKPLSGLFRNESQVQPAPGVDLIAERPGLPRLTF